MKRLGDYWIVVKPGAGSCLTRGTIRGSKGIWLICYSIWPTEFSTNIAILGCQMKFSHKKEWKKEGTRNRKVAKALSNRRK